MIPTGTYIGTLTKAHGYKGEMILRGNSQLLEELEPGTPLFIAIDEQRVPFFMEEITHAPGNEKCIIKFEFINSDKDALKYSTCKVYGVATKEKTSDSANNEQTSDKHISEYLNYTLHDTVSNQDFIIDNYIDSPDNPLLILKQKRKEILLPLNAGFIKSTNPKSKTVTASIPPELLSL